MVAVGRRDGRPADADSRLQLVPAPLPIIGAVTAFEQRPPEMGGFFMPYKDPEKAKAAKKEWDRKNRVGKRHQTWLAIFYPEDCPGWEQELSELGVPCLVSPLHDMDKWTKHDEQKYADRGVKAGVAKKPHRHLVASYEPGTCTYEQFREDFAFLGADGKGPHNVKYARSLSASTLYLAHETEDCKRQGKAAYDPSQILEYCGASYVDWRARTEDLHGQMKLMRAFIREYSVTEYCEFQDWCDENNDIWARLLDIKCAWAIGNYIDRRRAMLQAKGSEKNPNPEGSE